MSEPAGASRAGSLFIERLERKRDALGMDNERFAAHLGHSASFWSLLRRGKRRVSLDFARAVIGRWPEFSGYWAADLADAGSRDRAAAERRTEGA
jgi:hypothetical protein